MPNTPRKESSHNVEFAKGGSGHMFGKQSVGPQKPGQTAKAPAEGPQFASGGKGKMHGFAGVQSAKAGITSAR